MASMKSPKETEVSLISAAQKGDLKRVRVLLQAGADVDATDAEASEIHPGLNMAYREGGLEFLEKNDWKLGRTALMWAARHGHVEIVRLLVDSAAKVNAKDHVGLTPLMLAVINGNAEDVRILIDAGANLQAKERNGSTPLIFAVKSKKPVIVQALLAAGANVNVKSKEGTTPLMIAAEHGDPEVVQEFLKAGADPKVQAKKGPTALGAACPSSPRNLKGASRL
jgi:ankyrin repeat protein